GLGIVPLGSFLFNDRAVPDIIDCQISNERLLSAIRALWLVYDDKVKAYRTVDYKNLGSDELGSVFESLLELHPQINVPGRRFALATAAGNERKTTGSYYTPESLVHALLDSALDPVLEEATKKGEDAILTLKVCDPACGSGHFLIAAANRMAKALAFVRTGEEEPPPAAVQIAKRDIISHCIYGVDINPMAVELCKVNLWMEALEPGKPLNFLDHRIQVGNSLLGTTPRLMAGGIPDDAFKPIEGDDKPYVSAMRKVNKQERKDRETGQRSMFELIDPPADYSYLTEAMHALDALPNDTLGAVQRKEAQYAALARDPEYVKARLLADAWCAAFVWEKKAPTPRTSGSFPSPSGGGDQQVLPHEGEGFRMGANGGHFPLPMTDLLYRRMEDNPLADNLQAVREYVVELKERYQFFHWHVAFPDVFTVPEDMAQAENEGTGWYGGFDCVLGNPPWERIKIQEKEWFAERAPEIASAPNASARRKMIAGLAERDPYLLQAFADDKRKAEGESHFVRVSERYPLCGRGDVNTYTIFAETSRHIINGVGRVGMIVPSGIATDDTTKFFFQDLMNTRSLVSLYDFENREGLFPGVDSRMKFSLVTMTGWDAIAQQAEFVFFAHNIGDLSDDWRRFTLSAEDIAALNPNTGTMATFRSQQDAEITKGIYRRVPVLIQEEPLENHWGIRFSTMFHMSNDSDKFRTRDELESAGYVLQGNRFVAPTLNPSPSGGGTSTHTDSDSDSLPHEGEGLGMGAVYLPLYEAKMMHQFTHRWATYESKSPHLRGGDKEGGLSTRDMTLDELGDPSALPMPRYWVDDREITARINNLQWLVGFRDIARSTDERTAHYSLLPRFGSGNTLILVFSEELATLNGCFVCCLNSFACDFVVRQKVSGTHLTYNFVKQFPVIPPHTYTPALLDFIVPRVLELTYTAWDLQAFAGDVGYDGAPFVWDEERRFLMRCELDALYFHLYQIPREDVDYIMETFPIVKRKDIARTSDENGEGGEYITKRVILEMYDQMAELPQMAVPAPKSPHPPAPSPSGRGGEKVPPHEGEGFRVGVTYNVPDVSQWATWLSPGPASPDVAHSDERE
ncbi:MAG: hypothetical protein EA396_14140, partial [Anaerolineaceae bacterium]